MVTFPVRVPVALGLNTTYILQAEFAAITPVGQLLLAVKSPGVASVNVSGIFSRFVRTVVLAVLALPSTAR